jgi:Transcriptional regulatory protein, C terminal
VPGQLPYPREPVMAFGPYRLHRSRKQLLNADRPVPLGSKRELTAIAWPDSYVEESNLRVHIAALRKALDKGYIVNVPGRGYCFTSTVQHLSAPVPVTAPEPAPRPPAQRPR